MTTIEKIVIIVAIALMVGWGLNIIKFVQLDFKAPYKAEVIRGIGITPVGAILGWLKIEDN